MSEVKLIDANELKRAFEKVYPLATNEMGGVVNKQIYDIIDNAPTVEYSFYQEAYQTGYEEGQNERPHGEWICDYRYLDCKCSICNSYALERGDYPELSAYCPHCGAKMEVRINGT